MNLHYLYTYQKHSPAHLSVIYSLVLVYQKGNVPITTKAILPILPGFHQFPDSWHLGFGTVTYSYGRKHIYFE